MRSKTWPKRAATLIALALSAAAIAAGGALPVLAKFGWS